MEELVRRQTKTPDLPPFSEWYRRTIPRGWSVPRHIEFIIQALDRVVTGETPMVTFSLPPGHAKTSTITHRLPVHYGLGHPAGAAVFTGYNQTFAERNLSKPCREIARELEVLNAKTTAMDQWELTNGSRLVARGVGSAPTGINPIGLLVADDPIKDASEANSEANRANLHDWWEGSIIQRFWPATKVCVVSTRWHEDDLIGRLKATAGEAWTHYNLKAIAEEDDPLGRKPGEALWPEAKPRAFLDKVRAAMGEYYFQALYQGNPTPRAGSLFLVDRFEFCDPADVPALVQRVRAWDMAASQDGDRTAGVLIGLDATGRYYVLDCVAMQAEPDARNRAIRATAEMDGPSVVIRGPQDPGAAGKEAALAFTRLLAGFNVRTKPVSGDKVLRAEGFAAQVNAGNVALVRGGWNREFIEEFRQFPRGRFDDRIDAGADAFNELARPAATWDFAAWN